MPPETLRREAIDWIKAEHTSAWWPPPEEGPGHRYLIQHSAGSGDELRPEPDYKRLARGLLDIAIERQRQKNPASVKWYDEQHPYRHSDNDKI
jgi:hypothetical protein